MSTVSQENLRVVHRRGVVVKKKECQLTPTICGKNDLGVISTPQPHKTTELDKDKVGDTEGESLFIAAMHVIQHATAGKRERRGRYHHSIVQPGSRQIRGPLTHSSE